MKKIGRNDPCPCGSGKKYQHCCLKADSEEQTTTAASRSEAVPGAVHWLMARYGKAVREAIDEGFFGTLDDEEYAALREQHAESFEGILINAMEWLLADGSLTVRGQERRVSELLLGPGGPLFSPEQRQWIELLTSKPLGLYEVIDVVPGESLRLKDVLFPEPAPVLVKEKSGSRDAVKFDLMAARILPVNGHFELSGAVYSIPRHRSLELIAALRHELQGVMPHSPDAKEILSVLIPAYWLELFTRAFERPHILDPSTGEPLLWITDHYRVLDGEALEQALSAEPAIEGNREAGWRRLFQSQDGWIRSRLILEPGQRSDRIKATYRTQKDAEEGRPWLEQMAGHFLVFLGREIADPVGMLTHPKPGDPPKPGPPLEIPPAVMTEALDRRIRQLYANWADQPLPALDGRTPREAIQTAEGLEQVKFLLHTYEHGEMKQAREQRRTPVSYDFLWSELGITP